MTDDTMMECDMDDTTQIVEKCDSLEKPRTRKRKKIRRLVESGQQKKSKVSSCNKFKRILLITTLTISIISVLMGHYFIHNNSNINEILKQFLRNYRSHYTEIVHGTSNYCDQEQQLDTTTLFARIKQNHILHQEYALHQIENALRNESNPNIIALVGAVGVGKTLFVRALQEYFPWQENVQTIIWNIYVGDEEIKFNYTRAVIENLSDCGLNLLIIENLSVHDYVKVAVINQLLAKSIKKERKRVILFYVFSLNTMLTGNDYTEQTQILHSLPGCNVINFAAFSQNELRDCIQREAEIENITLTKEYYDEIVEMIDPFKSGCKNVNAKVLTYGTYKTQDDN